MVLGADHKLPLKSLSLPFLRSETRGGKRCARIFVERILLEFPCDHRGERWRLRRQVQSWPRPRAKSCSVRGGRRGPRAGAEDRVSLPPAPPSPPGVAPFSSPAAAARGVRLRERWRSFSSSHLFSLTCFRSRGLPECFPLHNVVSLYHVHHVTPERLLYGNLKGLPRDCSSSGNNSSRTGGGGRGV